MGLKSIKNKNIIKTILIFVFCVISISLKSQNNQQNQLLNKLYPFIYKITSYYNDSLTDNRSAVLYNYNDTEYIITAFSDSLLYNRRYCHNSLGDTIELENLIVSDSVYGFEIYQIIQINIPKIEIYKKNLTIGQPVYLIGSPLNRSNTLSIGNIVQLYSYVQGAEKMIQISAGSNTHTRGGAVINTIGELIGVARYIIQNTNKISYIIPLKIINESIDKKLNQNYDTDSVKNLDTINFKSVNTIKKNELIETIKIDSINENSKKTDTTIIISENKKIKLIDHKKIIETTINLDSTLEKNIVQKNIIDSNIIKENKKKILEITNQAQKNFNNGLYDIAIKKYEELIKFDPSNAKAYLNCGSSYALTGNFDKAIELMNQAIVINPEYEKAYANLGAFKAIKGNYENAQLYFLKAIKVDSNDYITFYNMGKLYYDINDFNSSILYFSKAYNLNPEDISIINSLSSAYLLYGDKINSKKYLNIGFGLDSNNINIINNLGNIYKVEKDFNKAEIYYKKALKLNPKDSSVLLNIALLDLELNKFKESEIILNNLLKNYKMSNDLLLYSLGYLKEKQGDTLNAINYYKSVLNLNYKNYNALYNLGIIYSKKGEFELAIQYLEQVIIHDPRNYDANFSLWKLYEFLGEEEKANFYMNKTLNLKN